MGPFDSQILRNVNSSCNVKQILYIKTDVRPTEFSQMLSQIVKQLSEQIILYWANIAEILRGSEFPACTEAWINDVFTVVGYSYCLI